MFAESFGRDQVSGAGVELANANLLAARLLFLFVPVVLNYFVDVRRPVGFAMVN